MKFKEKIEKYHGLEHERASLTQEIANIDEFLGRPADDKKNKKAIVGSLVFIVFAETGCYIPKATLDGLLTQRKTEAQKRLNEIDIEVETL